MNERQEAELRVTKSFRTGGTSLGGGASPSGGVVQLQRQQGCVREGDRRSLVLEAGKTPVCSLRSRGGAVAWICW